MRTGRPRKYSYLQVVKALQACGGNVSAAARLLECDRVTVWRYVKRLKKPGRG